MLALWIVALGALAVALWALWRSYRQEEHNRARFEVMYELLQFVSNGFTDITEVPYAGGPR